jgi:plasmid replication initiation protein
VISKDNLVVQSNPLIEARYSLSETEQKLLRVLISMIKPRTQTLEKRFYRLGVQDFADFLGHSNQKSLHKEMRRMAMHLLDAHVRVTKPNGNTLETSWITSFEYPKNKGWIEFEISSKLEDELLRVKDQFTQYYLANISNLKGEYSIRIYELVQQYAHSNMLSRTIDLDQLKTFLAVKYPTGTFFQRVIRPSHKEICTKTDTSFSFRPIKESRKIVAVEFYDIQKKTIVTSAILSLVPKKYRENKGVLKSISKYLKLHGPEYVAEKLQYVNSRKDIVNYSDYLYSVLENNHGQGFQTAQEALPELGEFDSGTVFEFAGKRYTYDSNGLKINEYAVMPPEDMTRALKAGTLTIVSNDQLQKEQLESLTKEFEEYRQQRVDEYVSKLSPQERKELEERFVIELNHFSKQIYRKNGMGSMIIRALFAEFVARNYLPEVNFPDFVREHT